MKEKIDMVSEPIIEYGMHYTYADYINFTYNEMVEVIRGKIFRMSPAPSTMHQRISGNLYFSIRKYLDNKSCKSFTAPFDVILPVKGKDFLQSDKIVQPDIVIICDPEKIREKGCFGAPDLIIEIISPFTSKKDIQLKYEIYEESGVKEYWIVEPIHQTIEVFILHDESYKRVTTYVQDDIIHCITIQGLSIDMKEVFAE